MVNQLNKVGVVPMDLLTLTLSYKHDLYTQAHSLIKRGLVYYGYPSSINNANGDLDKAMDTFQHYELIVFADGLQQPKHSDHNNTKEMIARLRKHNPCIEIFGYVPIGNVPGSGPSSNLPMSTLKERVNEWASMGVTGIFLDEFGYDFQVTRDRQNEIVTYCHDSGFNVVANAYQVDYVFSPDNIRLSWIPFDGNPSKKEAVIREDDYVMFESMFFSKNSSDGSQRASRTSRVMEAALYYETPRASYGGKTYKEQFGTKTWALDMLTTVDQNLFNAAYVASLTMGFDVYSVSHVRYGERNQPLYQLPALPPVFGHSRSKLKSAKYDGTDYALYESTIGGVPFKTIWKSTPPPEDRNPNAGIREVYVNHEPFRPVKADALPSSAPVGYAFFSSALGKPVWYNGKGWVDATGAAVSPK